MNRRKNDALLVGVTTILLIIGMVMVFSASSVMAYERYGTPMYFYLKQILWGFVCTLAIFFVSRYDYQGYARNKRPFLLILISIALLIGVLFFGAKVNGARRWFSLGFFSFQPSEFARLAAIIYFADIFARKGAELRNWKKGLLPHITVLTLIVVPIALETDLGSALMICMIIAGMMLASQVRFKHVMAGLILIAPIGAWVLTKYQSDRLTAWWNNLDNLLGSGYQIKQSLIGLGSGGILGGGPMSSNQKYFFLPDSHTDFVFAILGEEFGFIGTTLVLLLFMVILWRATGIARSAPTVFGQYLALGITLNIVLYALVNAAVVTMTMPTTGVPMPFISYGGSSLLSMGIAVGILINVGRHARQPDFEKRIESYEENREQLYRTLITMD